MSLTVPRGLLLPNFAGKAKRTKTIVPALVSFAVLFTVTSLTVPLKSELRGTVRLTSGKVFNVGKAVRSMCASSQWGKGREHSIEDKFIFHTLFVAPRCGKRRKEIPIWQSPHDDGDFFVRSERNERRESFFLAVKCRCDKTYCFLPSFSPSLPTHTLLSHATKSAGSTWTICVEESKVAP